MYHEANFFPGYSATWSRIPVVENPNPNTAWHWKKADPDCPFNTMSIPDGSTPLNQIFEEYAADQQKWINDYVPTFEKMINNGYTSEELTSVPDYHTGIICPRFIKGGYRYYSCYNESEISMIQFCEYL